MKKIIAILLVLVLSLSMVACGAKKEVEAAVDGAEAAVAEAVDGAEAAVEEVADGAEAVVEEAVDAVEGAVGILPDVEGFTKADMNGITTYTDEAGTSMMAVIKVPADKAVIEGIDNQNEEELAEMIAQQKTAYPDAEITGEFTTVAGKNVYKMLLSMPQGDATLYLFGVGSEMVVISATDMTGANTDGVNAKAEEIIAAL